MTLFHRSIVSFSSLFFLTAGFSSMLIVKPVFAETFVSSAEADVMVQTSLTVDPVMGNDTKQNGSVFKTITQALSVAQPGMTIKLKPGTYSSASGESFPLTIPSGVTLVGNEMNQGQDTVIVGGSNFASSWWGRQNATIVAKGSSSIKGITVTNPETRGTGIWVESSAATITHCLLTNNLRDGVFVAGKSSPTIHSNRFINNSANGVTVSNHSTGTISNNHFEKTGFGISISEDASPMIRDNRIQSNVDGIVVSHRAKPQILGNTIMNNDRDGVVIISEASPMLGSDSKPGRNSINGNGRHAINNASTNTFVSNVGNDIREAQVVSNEITQSAELPTLQSELNETEPSPSSKSSSFPGSLNGAKSVSIDGKKYISVEDMMRLLQ